MRKISLDVIEKFKEAFYFKRPFEEIDREKFFNDTINKNCKGIDWLYFSYEESYALIGVDGDDVYALDTEGFLVDVCDGLENVPYAMLSTLLDSGEDILQYNQEFETDLIKYEDWCKTNNIEINKDKVYHY